MAISRNSHFSRPCTVHSYSEKINQYVKQGYFVGLGSGSTAAYAIKEIGDRVKHEGIRVSGVPTSYQALMLLVAQVIPITTLEEHPTLDLTIDGADQIDKELNLINGMAGAPCQRKNRCLCVKKTHYCCRRE